MKTNNLILIFLLLTLISFKSEEKKNQKVTSYLKIQLDTTQIINNIKKQFIETNTNVKKFKKVEKEILGESSEGGEIIIFYNKNIIKKIVVTHFGEMGQNTTEYYYGLKKELFFIFKKTSHYNKPIYIKNSKIKYTEENRYYFFENNLIRWLDNKKKTVNSKSKKFNEEFKALKEEEQDIHEKIKN
jgi:hypothetical protein